MSISNSVRALLKLCGKRQSDLVSALDMKSIQSLNNKFYNERWSASDLVDVASVCGCRLAFVMGNGTILPIPSASGGSDPVQAAPVGEYDGAVGGLVTPMSSQPEQNALSD